MATAHAQDASRAHLVTQIDSAAFGDHFPAVALARGVSGRAVLSCNVAPDGSSQCAAASETPANMGFGAAAVSLAQGWRFTPQMQNGQAVASTVRVPITFQNPTDQSVPISPDINVDAPRGAASLTSSRRDQFARFYPERARQSAANGRALVACVVRSAPRIECAVEREAPEGWGFGASAVAAATEVLSRQPLHPGDRTRVTVDFAVHSLNQSPAPRNFFETTPSGDDFIRYYPGGAFEAGTTGLAMLNCTILADGRLNCDVASETPRDRGFGAAGVQLSRRYKFLANELTRPGHSVGDHIILGIGFALPE